MAAWLALLILVVSGFVLVGRHDAIVIGGMNAAELAMTASGLLLTVWLSGALLPQMRDTHPRAYRFILKGGSLALVVALTAWLHGPIRHGAHAAWTAWGRNAPLPRVVTDSIDQWTEPARRRLSATAGERAVRIRGRANGQFFASANLNGTPATMLVDSGAATVLLKTADARNAGIDMSQLELFRSRRDRAWHHLRRPCPPAASPGRHHRAGRCRGAGRPARPARNQPAG